MAATALVTSFALGLFSPPALRGASPARGAGAGLELGQLGVGTWAWGNKLLWGYDTEQDEELRAAFEAATRGGVRFFDTGDSYGTGALEGRAEVLLGQFRRELKPPRPCVFATKLAIYPWRLTSASFVGACRASLERMGLEQLEVAQAHWSAQKFQPWQEAPLWEGLADCYDLNLCRAVGLSNYGPKQLAKAAEYFRSRGTPLVLNQVQLSLLSTAPVESGLLELCAELGIRPVAYSPLALGALSGKYSVDRLPPGPRGAVVGLVLRGAPELLGVLDEIARARRKTVAQIALNWTMRLGALPIVGVRSAAQVADNLGATKFRLSEAEMDELNRAAAKVRRPATQNIFMTD